MTAKLVALSGPLQGAEIPLEKKLTIGRDPSNSLHISDISISRQHCVINEGQIFDLDSLNGTFVNGVPVQERQLHHGDRIDIGSSRLLYLSEGEAASPVEFDSDQAPGSTIFLKQESLAPDAIWTFLSEIHRVRTIRELQRRLMELLFDAIPAESGAIVFAQSSAEEFTSAFGWDRTANEQVKVRVSKSVADLVLTRGEGLLSFDAIQQFGEAQSIAESGTGSILCAPLFKGGKVSGFIYLQNPSAGAFTEKDLRMLSMMSSMASVAFENLQNLEWLVEENRRLRDEALGDSAILGESAKVKQIHQFIAKASATDSTVLISGESGTGKELVARALHEQSSRSNKPFVAINCAALTEPLLESELFGHERGAFTGAIAQKRGKLEVADGGTVFLDEVAELTPSLQAKLLRVLQDRSFERVGGLQPIHVNIRIVAATNRDLKAAIKEGSFREDLYYRLNVLPIQVPPLRDRATDIPLLATYFASRFGAKFQKRILGISPEARAKLTNYAWPGNIRELENAIERAVVLGAGEYILPEDLPEEIAETKVKGDLSRFHDAVRETKKQLILNAVESTGGNFTEAARLLGLHPNYLHRLIRNLEIRDLINKL